MWTSFTGNASAVVASIAALITLSTFFYKDVVERRRRRHLGIATLVFQIRLLAHAIDNDLDSAPLLSPGALLAFADLYVVDKAALLALDVFNEEYSLWQKRSVARVMLNSDEKNEKLQLLSQHASHFN